MANIKKMFKSLFSKFKTKKFTEYVIAGILAFVILAIFLSSCSKKGATLKNNVDSLNTQDSEPLSYVDKIENKLVNVLGSVKGCNSVKVMVVTDVSESDNIAMKNEEKTTTAGNSTSQEPIYEKSGSTETPYVTSKSYPKITGVLVVASGAGDPNVKLKIINAIVAVLGVDVSKIEVLEGK